MVVMLTLLLSILLLLPVCVQASLPPPEQRLTITLADDRQLVVTTGGDRDNLWVRTLDGRYLVQQQGYWMLARRQASGRVESTGVPIVPGVQLPAQTSAASALVTSPASLTANSTPEPERQPYRFTAGQYQRQPLLVVRVAFANQGFVYSDAEVARRFFGNDNSVSHFFAENSYHNFDIVPVNEFSGSAHDGVVSVRLDSNHPDFGTGYGVQSQNLARAALQQLPASLTLENYDRNQDRWLDPNELAIVFLVAGYEQAYTGAGTPVPRLWAHKSSLYQGVAGSMRIGEYAMFGERHQDHLATMGIICHELGHLLFDLPDLYDRYGKSMGVGRWGLMGLGGWNAAAGPAGSRPAHMMGWSKQEVGFLAPGHAGDGQTSVHLRALSDGADLLEIPLDGYRHGARLLLEHRRLSSYDAGLPGAGILLTRINDRVGYGPLGGQNDDVNNPLVDVEEANGNNDLDVNRNRGDAGDVFSLSQNALQFSEITPSPLAQTSAVTLLQLQAGVVADIDVRIRNPVYGDNIGLAEVGPNAVRGNPGDSSSVLMRMPLYDNVVWLDGLDWFSPGQAQLSLTLYSDDPRRGGQPLQPAGQFSLQPGWNRLMLPQRQAAEQRSFVYLQLDVLSLDSRGPLAVDLQGRASGNTWWRQEAADYQPAAFDVAARLLVMNRDVAAVPGVDAAPAADVAPSSSGAGGLSWLLLPLLWLAVRYRWL